MPPLTPYTCPRCEYKTRLRNDMRRHLYNSKKICPGIKLNIELTTQIKDHILDNRVYNIKHEQSRASDITVNLNNSVLEMTAQAKLNNLVQYENLAPINFGDQIEQKLSRKIQKLDDRSWQWGFKLDQTNLLELIDELVHLNDHTELDNLNILYDAKLHKIYIYHDDEWLCRLFDQGLNEIVNIIRNYFLVSYEYFMLYKIFVDRMNINAIDYNNFKLQLNEYYKFLLAFDLYPSCRGHKNTEIVGRFNHDNEYHISEYCMNRYNGEKEALKTSEKNKLRKSVADIIKGNHVHNIKILNKHIINLAINDEMFKTKLLSMEL